MKLINNAYDIQVKAQDDGTTSFVAVGSEVGVVNRNGMILMPNSIKFDRERYPLLYSHGKSAVDVIGDSHTEYDPVTNTYITDFKIYDGNENIKQAVENGAFSSVSIAYYLTDYDFNADGSIVVNNAVFNEVSIVSVPADPNAKFIENSMSDELLKERHAFLAKQKAEQDEKTAIENQYKEIEEIKKKYE